MSKSVTQKLKDSFVPSLFTGASAAGIYYFLLKGNQKSAKLFGISVNPTVGVGVSSMVSDLVGNVSSEFVLPLLSGGDMAVFEGKLLVPALTGAATTLTLSQLSTVTNVSTLNGFLLGASSSVLGKYASDMVMKKYQK